MSNISNESVLRVIKGQTPLCDLIHGGAIRIEGQFFEIITKVHILVHPTPSDIACGLMKYRSNPDELREWAQFVLGASQFVDLDSIERSPFGELLIETLWDASFTGQINKDIDPVLANLRAEIQTGSDQDK